MIKGVKMSRWGIEETQSNSKHYIQVIYFGQGRISWLRVGTVQGF
jgi:hypothetical protein